MGTKSQYRKDKLQFYNNSMIVSGGAAGTVVTATGTACQAEMVLVSDPYYAGNFSTANNTHFTAKVGGILSSSSSVVTFTLRHGTDDVLELACAGTKSKSTKVPYQVEFNGKYINTGSSVGIIHAQGKAHIDLTTATDVWGGTTGGASGAYGTTDFDFTANTTLGLNVTAQFGTTSGSLIENMYGSITYVNQ